MTSCLHTANYSGNWRQEKARTVLCAALRTTLLHLAIHLSQPTDPLLATLQINTHNQQILARLDSAAKINFVIGHLFEGDTPITFIIFCSTWTPNKRFFKSNCQAMIMTDSFIPRRTTKVVRIHSTVQLGRVMAHMAAIVDRTVQRTHLWRRWATSD